MDGRKGAGLGGKGGSSVWCLLLFVNSNNYIYKKFYGHIVLMAMLFSSYISSLLKTFDFYIFFGNNLLANISSFENDT